MCVFFIDYIDGRMLVRTTVEREREKCSYIHHFNISEKRREKDDNIDIYIYIGVCTERDYIDR